jgi:hypothetical protein
MDLLEGDGDSSVVSGADTLGTIDEDLTNVDETAVVPTSEAPAPAPVGQSVDPQEPRPFASPVDEGEGVRTPRVRIGLEREDIATLSSAEVRSWSPRGH